MLVMESVDLHEYTLEEANKIIGQLINESYLENVKKLIVVKRKGLHSRNYKDPLFFKRFKYFNIFCS
jgi:DNA-nicking Smr family endonuclease